MYLPPALAGFFIFVFLAACAGVEKSPPAAAALYEKAQKLKNRSSFEKALQVVDQLTERFPYSAFKFPAMRITADIYFEREEYDKALPLYERLSLFSPDAEKGYMLYRAGLCYLKRLPKTPDRDIQKADSALRYFQEAAKLPDTKNNKAFKEKAKKSIEEILNMRAEKEWITASFYIRRGALQGALNRLDHILFLYPKSKAAPKALLSAFQVSQKLGRSSKTYQERLQTDFPHLLPKPDDK